MEVGGWLWLVIVVRSSCLVVIFGCDWLLNVVHGCGWLLCLAVVCLWFLAVVGY